WRFPSMLANFAARQTSVGRKVGKQMNANDVFTAARDNKISLEHLEEMNSLDEALAENSATPVPDQVAFRLDFPACLKTQTSRNRNIVRMLGCGYRAMEVGHRFQLSQGRITQLRQLFKHEWEIFIA